MRTIVAGAQTVLNSAAAPLVLFVQMDLTTTMRLNTSTMTIAWGGFDWLGAGAMGAIEEVEDVAADQKGLRFTLSGVPADMLALALSEPIRNKPCSMYMGILDPTTHAVLDAPLVWAGTLDQMPITQSGGTCSISATAEHAGVTFSRPKPLRYTDADQQKLYPGDTSLRFVVSQANHQDTWPAAAFFRQ